MIGGQQVSPDPMSQSSNKVRLVAQSDRSDEKLASCEKRNSVHIQSLSDAFQKIQRGGELGIFDLPHVATADIRAKGKLFLAETAVASQILNVQRYSVPQGHDRETAMARYIVPRDICYIRRCA